MSTISKAFELLEQFKQLSVGWNFGQGVPSTPSAARSCQLIMSFVKRLKFDDIDAFPGIDGEIQLCIYLGAETLELVFEPNGTVTITLEKDDAFQCIAENVSTNKAFQILKDFKYNRCRDYTSLISSTISPQERDGFQVWPSDQRRVESPLLIKSVPRIAAGIFVNTSGHTTPQSQVIPLYSGKFQLKQYPKAAKLFTL